LRASMKSNSLNQLIFSTAADIEALRLDHVDQSATFASSVSATGTGATIKAFNSSLASSENISIAVGKESSSQNAGFLVWQNNASAGARYLSLETFGGNSPIQISASNFDINTAGAATFNSSVTATAFNTSSDYRLKEDFKEFSGLEMVCNIPVYDYKWKENESRAYGVIAHELQEVLPNAVTSKKDGEKMQAVDYSKIVPLLIKSIQELKAEIELLKNK
jgi:hypothetical protein